MEIGDPLAGLAAEFAQVMTGGSTGDEPQINEPPTCPESAGNRHGHVVDTGDVLQRAEWGHLPSQPQQFVDILIAESLDKLPVFRAYAAFCQLRVGAERKIQPRVEGQCPPFRGKENLQKLQKAKCAVPLGGGVPGICRRVEQGCGHLIGIAQPALLRFRCQTVQQWAECLQRLGAGNAPPDGLQGGELRGPVHLPEQTAQIGAVHAQLSQKHLVSERIFHPER